MRSSTLLNTHSSGIFSQGEFFPLTQILVRNDRQLPTWLQHLQCFPVDWMQGLSSWLVSGEVSSPSHLTNLLLSFSSEGTDGAQWTSLTTVLQKHPPQIDAVILPVAPEEVSPELPSHTWYVGSSSPLPSLHPMVSSSNQSDDGLLTSRWKVWRGSVPFPCPLLCA